MKFIIKKIFNFFGFQLKRKKNIEFFNISDFTAISDKNKDWKLISDSLKKIKRNDRDIFTDIRFYSLIHCVKNVLSKNRSEDFVELGCWKGQSTYIISKLIKESRKKINFHIFDSFKGLSIPTKKDNIYTNIKNNFTSSESFLKNNVLKDFKFTKTYAGWIPSRFKEIKNKKFSLVHVDLCMYEPTLESLKFFFPRLVKGGVIISNCYNSEVFPGESKAWDDFFINKEYSFIYKHALSTSFVIK